MATQTPWSFRIERLTDEVKIRLSANRMTGVELLTTALSFFFLAIFLVLFPTIGVKALIASYQNGIINFIAIFLALLFLFGFVSCVLDSIFLGYLFFWQITGVETLEINSSILKSQKAILGYNHVKEYKREQIANITLNKLEVVPRFSITKIMWMFSGKLMGQIIVTLSDGRNDYLGLGLTQEQATELIQTIRESLYSKNA